MHKKTEKNPLGAGRNKRDYEIYRPSVPVALREQINQLIKEWKKK